ncbi:MULTISPECIES: helix-turn-helix domain-containing protein [Photobacterium]|uniref:helix-turn-helix domain-containing protein n=1 Tax=Photobacterium TaxID=657 RepID=UPI0021C2672D|nr:helix-turn-helix transcriptional regulator [Photobacterium sanguinicancri]
MQKLTKHDTILWINHAIANFKSLGKNQKDLATKLGLEESRLSEMKNGAGTISPSLMERIVDLCGAPRRNSGRFETVEVYDSLDTFFELFRPVTENRFFRNLIETFNKESYINQVCKHSYLEPGTFDCSEPDAKRALTIARINELIRSEEFCAVCVQYKDHLHQENGRYFDWKNDRCGEGWQERECFKMNGLYIKEFRVFHGLYLLWILSSQVDNYCFASGEPVNLNPLKDITPVVLIGSCLLFMQNSRLDEHSPINQASKELFGKKEHYSDLNGRMFDEYEDLDYISGESFHFPDFWGNVCCELYLSDNMNYHLLIHLAPSMIIRLIDPDIDNEYKASLDINQLSDIASKDRAAVITNINPLDLFRQIEEVRKWCGLPQDSHYELKKQIAKAGGYIPGAKVLV